MKHLSKFILVLSIIACLFSYGHGETYAKTNTSAKAEGVYVGQNDNQTIEVKVGKIYKTFRLLESNRHLIKGIKKGDVIEFTYWVNVKKQNILGSKLTKKQQIKTATGYYVGQIDANSIEIKVNGVPDAFRLSKSNQHLIRGLDEGDKIIFTYSVNYYGQNVLGSKLYLTK